MKSKLYLLSLLLLCLLLQANKCLAQVKEKKLVQLSGVVVTSDSLRAVAYTNILVKNKFRGTTSDYYGYFSIATEVGDTLVFSCIGFKKSMYVIPNSLQENHYSVVHVMQNDTLLLAETVIYPWPSKEQFRDAFMALNAPDDEITRAQKNLDPEQMAERTINMPMSGAMSFMNQMQLKQQQMYYTGQAPPIQLLNPFAWASFIKAWQEGKFKRKDKDKN